MQDLTKQKNENEYQYLWRVDNMVRSGRYKNWEEVTPYVNRELYGEDEFEYKGESAFRKKVAAARQFYEAGVFDTFNEDAYLKKLKEQKDELEREKIQLRDERTIYGRDQRVLARLDTGLDLLEKLIKDSTPYYDAAPIFTLPESDRDLLVCLSDVHMGLVTEGLYGKYDPDIAKAYVSQYVEYIADIATRHCTQNCYVAILGDMINGRIHLTTMIENRDDVIQQTQSVSELVSWFLSELSKLFDHVYVNSVSGNHSRIDRKDAVLRTERLDNLVCWYAKARLCNCSNIIFMDDTRFDPTIGIFNIQGLLFLLCHGDYDSADASGVQKLTMMVGEVPYAVVMGHRHATTYQEISGVRVIQCGTLAGSGSDYCIEKRIIGEPSQAVAVVSDKGIEAFYPVTFGEKGK